MEISKPQNNINQGNVLVTHSGATQPPIIIAQPQQPIQYVIPVASNQIYAAPMYNSDIFMLDPVLINCPFCHQNVTTTVEPTFSCCACCICLCTGLLIFILIQLCRNKNICCQDAVHYCPNCNNKVGFYKAI